MPEKIISDNSNTIGKNIRRMRIDRGIGQSEMVRQLQLMDINITRETLVKIERGQQHIKLDQIRGIKEILDTSYDSILDNDHN
ncbi:helix-turn-helix domain-containing protein [Enterococcus avium]|uniref:helix-turn-helix domain-containing protein n=1 Tax=Enterococcus avium TaxID=33945 RepID=UPI001F59E03A|nr:helix-turn-helix transcriptional regulator [Enterococcus avium]